MTIWNIEREWKGVDILRGGFVFLCLGFDWWILLDCVARDDRKIVWVEIYLREIAQFFRGDIYLVYLSSSCGTWDVSMNVHARYRP